MIGYVAFDFDGTIAYHDGSTMELGKPIPAMIEKVKWYLAQGVEVRIFTARASYDKNNTFSKKLAEAWVEDIKRYCLEHIGQVLTVTNEKDYGMIRLYDDRCVQVETNTGRIIGESTS